MSHLKNKNTYPTSFYAWYVVSILTLAYISSFLDRQILSLMVDDIRRDMKISEFQISLLMGFSFALFYTLLGLPIGRLADRYNRRNIIIWGIVIWSFMTGACGLVRNYGQFFLARVGVGIGEATLSPTAYSMITDYFPKHKLATALSVYAMGIYLGSGLALVIGGQAYQLAAIYPTWTIPLIGEVYAWQMVFFFVGLPGILIALLMFTVREPVRKDIHPDKQSVSFKDLFQYLGKHRKMILTHNFSFALLTLATYGGSYWIPAHLMRNFAWTKAEVGLKYGLIITFFATIGVLIGGRLSDYWFKSGYQNSRQAVILIGIIGLMISLFILPWIVNESLLITILVFIAFFSSFGIGTGTAVVQEIVPPTMRAQASAIFLFVVNLIGLGIGPSLVAIVTESIFQDDKAVGFSLMLVSTLALMIAVLLVFMSMKPYRQSLATIEEMNRNKS